MSRSLEYVDLVLFMSPELHPYDHEKYDELSTKRRLDMAREIDEREVHLAYDPVLKKPFTVRQSVDVLAQDTDGAWYIECMREYEKQTVVDSVTRTETRRISKMRPRTYSETRLRGESAPAAALRGKRQELKLRDDVGILKTTGLTERLEEYDSSVYLGVRSARLTVTIGLLVPAGLWGDTEVFEDTQSVKLHVRRYTEWPFREPPPFHSLA